MPEKFKHKIRGSSCLALWTSSTLIQILVSFHLCSLTIYIPILKTSLSCFTLTSSTFLPSVPPSNHRRGILNVISQPRKQEFDGTIRTRPPLVRPFQILLPIQPSWQLTFLQPTDESAFLHVISHSRYVFHNQRWRDGDGVSVTPRWCGQNRYFKQKHNLFQTVSGFPALNLVVVTT